MILDPAARGVVCAALSLPILVGLPTPSRAADEDAPRTESHEVLGRLQAAGKPADAATAPRLVLEVGSTRYYVEGGPEVASRAARLVGRWVSVRGAVGLPQDGLVPIRPETADALLPQEPATVVGVVESCEGADGKPALRLSAEDGAYAVTAGDAPKLQPFAGLRVALEAFVARDAATRMLVGVKKVERRLRPGERDPRSGSEAIAGKWKGTTTVTEAPKGTTGDRLGDYPIEFATDGKSREATGRLWTTYDVIGVRVRKFEAPARAAEIEITYAFTKGTKFALKCEGAFRADWRVFEGTWHSDFLGKGKFRIELVPADGDDKAK